MATEEVSIDLSNTEINDFRIGRDGEDSQQLQFSVKGRVRDVDEQKAEDVMLSNKVKPVSITLEIDKPASEE